MIYLASPYSNPPEERVRRYRQNLYAAGFLITQGWKIFSPILHSHAVDQYLGTQKLQPSPEYWYDADFPFMTICNRIIVLQLRDWKKSRGVEREISYFWNQRQIKAEFMHPATYHIHELPWPGID